MTAALRALPTVFSIGLQRQLAYRWNYLLRALFSAVPLLVSWVFWEAVFQGKETVGRYTLAGLLTYYAVLLIVEAVSSPADDDFQISREIREGMLNPILLRPLPYGLYRGALFLSGRCAYLVAAFIPVLLCFFILSRVVHIESAAFDILRGGPALFGSALLQFSLTLCLSLTSFWFLDISSLIFLVYSLEFLAGGHVFPLDLLPAPLFTIARLLPFAYEYWFPAAALCGTLTHREWQIGIGMQFAWAIFFSFSPTSFGRLACANTLRRVDKSMPYFIHLLKLWLIQVRYAITRELAFRANFFAWVIVELAWFVLQLAFVGVVYQHVDSVAGWNRYEMIVLVATNQLIQQIFTAFLMPGLVKLPDLVRTGGLDFLLLKPAPPQFLVSTSSLEIGPLANAGIALVVVLSALHSLAITPTLSATFTYLLLVLAGLFVHYALLLTLVSFTFWIVQAESVLLGYYSIFQVARLPREATRGWFRVIFTFAIPLLLVANVPASILLRSMKITPILLFLGTSLSAALLASLFFYLGLRRYQSASS